MSDFEDDLQPCEAQTAMLRRVCNAIEEYGDHTDWKNNRTDQLLVLSSAVRGLGYFAFRLDKFAVDSAGAH